MLGALCRFYESASREPPAATPAVLTDSLRPSEHEPSSDERRWSGTQKGPGMVSTDPCRSKVVLMSPLALAARAKRA
jgi:hypothetical protein